MNDVIYDIYIFSFYWKYYVLKNSTGTSVFGIKLVSGSDFPGVGLSRATCDVNGVLGSENGEISFFPSGRHILANNGMSFFSTKY